ncbi:porin family protein, partial [bacterium]
MNVLTSWKWCVLLTWTLVCLVVTDLRAEDAERLRTYFRFGSGGISSVWEVDDLWSVAIGANLNGRWSTELEVANFEKNHVYRGYKIGEVGTWLLLPQARFRWSPGDRRLVPYLLAGAGAAFYQFNDPVAPSSQISVAMDGTVLALAAGAGLDYFIADNVALSMEAKYLWLQKMSGRVNGESVSVD